MNKTHYIIALLSLLVSTQLLAQGRLSEAELNEQKRYIEANKEKVLGNIDEAIVIYKEIFTANKKNHAAAFEIARLLESQDKFEDALPYIKKAAQQDNNEWYGMLHADILMQMENDQGAAAVYKDLVDKNPNNEYYYHQWAFYLMRAKQPTEALAVYQKIEDRFEFNEDIIKKKHSLYLVLQDEKNAEKELLKLVQRFPKGVEYRYWLADFYEISGKKSKSKKIYQEILALDPDQGKAKMALAGEQAKKGNDVDFLNSLGVILADKNIELDEKVAKLFPFIQKLGLGDMALDSAAIKASKLIADTHPEAAKAHALHGDVLYNTKNTEAAIPVFEKTRKLDASVFSVWEQLMFIYFETRQSDKLYELTNEALDLFPNQARVYYFNGLAAIDKGINKNALSSFQQALIMSRKNPELQTDILYRIGALHYSSGDFDKAMATLDKSFKLLGNEHPSVLDLYGDIMFQKNNIDKAVSYWKQSQQKGNKSEELTKKIENKQIN